MHSSMIGESLRKHACRMQQSRTRNGDTAPETNPDIYVGVEQEEAPGHTDIRRTKEFFEYLNERLTRNYPWSEEETAFNPEISAGYTYLGQLVSHDLFLGDGGAPSLRNPSMRKNVRRDPLALETVYGTEPHLNAQIFERPSDQPGVNYLHWPRTRFRLDGVGQEVNDWSRDTSSCPRRDIGRIRNVRFGQEYGCPLIADERNDDHAILSQLTALFQLTHNTILDLIECNEKPSDPLESANNFSIAQAAVTYVYRCIVREDLLARLIDPLVRNYYEGERDSHPFVLCPSNGSVLTPDFLNAAYRMGHSMVRSDYQFTHDVRHNLPEVMRNSSFRAPGRTPLKEDWIVQWSMFFPMSRALHRPQPSRRISPRYVAALISGNLVAETGPSEIDGLAYRDLLRVATTGVMKVPALADLICERAPELAEQTPWISDPEAREGALSNWLGGSSGASPYLKEFVENPPPNIYYLIEAAEAYRGERLGPIGSVVLAETFYRALEPRSQDDEEKSAANEIFGANVPATMPDLIAWLDRNMRTDDKVFDDRCLPLV